MGDFWEGVRIWLMPSEFEVCLTWPFVLDFASLGFEVGAGGLRKIC